MIMLPVSVLCVLILRYFWCVSIFLVSTKECLSVILQWAVAGARIDPTTDFL